MACLGDAGSRTFHYLEPHSTIQVDSRQHLLQEQGGSLQSRQDRSCDGDPTSCAVRLWQEGQPQRWGQHQEAVATWPWWPSDCSWSHSAVPGTCQVSLHALFLRSLLPGDLQTSGLAGWQGMVGGHGKGQDQATPGSGACWLPTAGRNHLSCLSLIVHY